MNLVFVSAAPLRLLLAGAALGGLLIFALVSEPDASCGALLCFLAALWPALLALGVVNARDSWRAFALGGFLPALAAFILAFGLLLIGAANEDALLSEALERAAHARFGLAAVWLLAGCVGLAAAALRHLALLDLRQVPIAWLKPQFRLRTLFVLVAIIAAWAANYRVQALRSRQEQDALEALTQSGARVLSEAGDRYPSWVSYLLGPSFHNTYYSVILQAPQLNEDTFARLEHVPHLVDLTVEGPAKSEAEVEQLIDRFPQCHVWRQ